jgi:hypothetical protein
MSRSRGAEDPLQEAVAVFTRARYAREPARFVEHTRRAAAALLESVLKAAGEAGYEVRADPQGQRFIKRPGDVAGLLRISSDNTGIHLAYFQLGEWKVVADPKLEYDPAKGLFVGAMTDESRYPMPGSSRQPPRMSAATTVAIAIVAAFDRG